MPLVRLDYDAAPNSVLTQSGLTLSTLSESCRCIRGATGRWSRSTRATPCYA